MALPSDLMFLFYDFETSSRELLGQILGYSFVLCDAHLNIMAEKDGWIKLNRTQLPDVEALLVNRINIQELQEKGVSEETASKEIFEFLESVIQKYQEITLVGFNSNRFDLNFLRNLLIRYGHNPYFFGRLKNLDILHFTQSLAFQFPEQFPWTLSTTESGQSYYAFNLESTAKAFGILDTAQSHDAKADVLLTIALVKALETQFKTSLEHFSAFKRPTPSQTMLTTVVKTKSPHFPNPGETPEKWQTLYYRVVCFSKKEYLVLNLNRFKTCLEADTLDDAHLVECIQYLNPNKHFFQPEPLTEEEQLEWLPFTEASTQFPLINNMRPSHYFELTKKDWDIEYQIHQMGFERIEALKVLIETISKTPSQYASLVQDLWEKRKEDKDVYLVQLFNRFYLNYHPSPALPHLQKYLKSRYVTGDLLRNPEDFVSLDEREKKMDTLLKSPETPETDKRLLTPLQKYYQAFRKQFQI